MSKFNYGINCSNAKDAEKLFQQITKLDIYQDGLDVDDERVSVISTQALLKDIESFAKKTISGVSVEVWDSGAEYDDAEADGTLETYEFSGKPNAGSGSSKLSKFAAYSGEKAKILMFKQWLMATKPEGLNIVEEWEPEEEFGSYGIIFTCNDAGFKKLCDKEWLPKGVVTEKKKS